MRLRRESHEDVQEGSTEYKVAVKSVIRYQIQSLLQKLALETGEESIVISTNVNAGTYNHLGSYLGQEYLDDGDEFVQTICSRFTDFCANVQGQSGVIHFQEDSIVRPEIPSNTTRTKLPAPRKTPRKRPFTSHNNFSPPHKRLASHQYSMGFQSNTNDLRNDDTVNSTVEDNSCQSREDNNNSSQTSKENPNPCYVMNIPWIKSEPVEEFSPGNLNGNSDQDSMEESSSMSITNRPRSLIPLANIFKKYGSKTAKTEPSVTPESLPGVEDKDDELPSEKSILRSLYEQPLYHTEDYSSGGTIDGDKTGHTPINLPQNLSDSLENFPSTTENLVLSGYYDAENYPAYRHNRKHPTNSGSKKSKPKEKTNSSNANSPVPGSAIQPEAPATVPSGGDLKMRMFESGGRLVYACDVCKRELSHLTSYRRHMKLHTMDRPHKCPVCSKGFIRKYHCIDHLNKHHKGVDFDHDTLTLRGNSKGLEEPSAFSESISISPSEYNYTLDQSIEETDESMNANCSIDQSASSMLSELAKSAQKAHLLDLAENSACGQSLSELKTINSSATSGNSSEIKVTNELNSANENGSDVKELLLDKSSPAKTENSAMARKYEVTEGIKAIVAHLKSSSKKKKTSAENEPPVDKA